MRVPVLFLAIAYLSPTVAGWAFRVLSTVITEGADAFFEVTDDGGGFWFPYTMTVFKRGSNSSDEQVGLVLTNGNDTEFSWNCNQPAGSSLRFSLMSAARVNAARSGYYEVQPSFQAMASSLSAASIRSTSLQGQTQTTATSATATSAPSDSSNKAPVGAIVGAAISGVLLLVALGAIVFLVRRRKKSSADTQNMVQYDPHPHVTPFLDGRTEQTIVPPAGYVSYSNFEEEPPVYSPRTPEATTYYTGSESGRTESSYRPPLLSGKARYLPVRT
ncbi:hypothetical protein RSOLAG1IB_07496 [Rhizoctonia solani AG-1 IB]|uniref:Uncharacterized protein n=1 Tax=Thanatephorus cucumeris (strain AG1-IB / isolate 7/3/14) TaxID=1108050 RepID=A0A0B7FIJ5_THACB|nr:hypothetical protein RSOLAG1IB_07496 [Rhizoctonia solani AG-1 IB]